MSPRSEVECFAGPVDVGKPAWEDSQKPDR